MTITLDNLGWDSRFEETFRQLAQPGWYPARIIRETKINYTVIGQGTGDHDVVLSGKIWNDATSDADLPAVGDWVAVDPGQEGDIPVIRARLPRKTCFSRKAPGKNTAEQVIGTNIDIVVIVTDAAEDFNPRRIERYLTLVRKSGADPIVLINKADQTPKPILQEAVDILRSLSPDLPVHPISARKRKGYPDILALVPSGLTITIVGSSGVGKSTLVNSLLGEEWLDTGDVNAVTGKGRHTTVARELVILPDGGCLIDNPGMREIQMWTDAETLRANFADLAELAAQCKFADCSHGKDTGCAIRAAVENGTLSQERYEHYMRLDEEIEELVRRSEKRQMTLERVNKRKTREKIRNYEDRRDQRRDRHPNRPC